MKIRWKWDFCLDVFLLLDAVFLKQLYTLHLSNQGIKVLIYGCQMMQTYLLPVLKYYIYYAGLG